MTSPRCFTGPNALLMPYAMSFEVIGAPSSNLMPLRRW